MKKSVATFLFAVGVGMTFNVSAGTCQYYCIKALKWCLQDAGDDMEKQADCYTAQDDCMTSC
ncbi:hypothetical protein GTP41_24745 [Pseudoduganella sp. DS3]|uniref:Uncharacterized protein n=1 Tax=Pseudoduganella guangdongensis TaxID=2692179 RepID=A0A6N9HP52_9BURK|nr:hypothetical protein [Pseudoduganella guangdongensis]MYN05310.1 hypothetical protein [Pseudoduganella guangdongensis]